MSFNVRRGVTALEHPYVTLLEQVANAYVGVCRYGQQQGTVSRPDTHHRHTGSHTLQHSSRTKANVAELEAHGERGLWGRWHRHSLIAIEVYIGGETTRRAGFEAAVVGRPGLGRHGGQGEAHTGRVAATSLLCHGNAAEIAAPQVSLDPVTRLDVPALRVVPGARTGAGAAGAAHWHTHVHQRHRHIPPNQLLLPALSATCSVERKAEAPARPFPSSIFLVWQDQE
jgi:hypothetical protein